MAEDIRWIQRLTSFERAATRLGEPLARDLVTLSALENEGTVQRFEFTLELAWKTLKDYMEHEGHVITPVTPRNVVKEAFAAGIVRDGQVWLDMLDHRNLLSHTYDALRFAEAVKAIRERYYPALEDVRIWLSQRRTP
ncbi:MAG: nucleotidyltransferase substrate binding protein [Gemmatimonadaceae bacterium]